MLKKKNNGFTIIELIVVAAIVAILAAIAIPVAETSVKREKEIELRRALRTIRTAIDEYRDFVIENKIKVDEDTYSYPEKLEDLVEGIEFKNKKNKTRIKKFLRRIPRDPFSTDGTWAKRSYQDDHDASKWGEENVWNVFSNSEKKALDGTRYSEW